MDSIDPRVKVGLLPFFIAGIWRSGSLGLGLITATAILMGFSAGFFERNHRRELLWTLVLSAFVGLFGISEGWLASLRLALAMFDTLAVIHSVVISTSPVMMALAFQWLFGWLSYVGVPGKELGFVMGMTVRFVEILEDEVERIILAQRARGIAFRGFRDLVFWMRATLVPVFVSILRKADRIALAMFSRGIDPSKGIPTTVRLCFKPLDALVGSWLVACAVLGVLGL